jgi:hypothetical protein
MCRCTSASLLIVFIFIPFIIAFTGCSHISSDPLTYQPRAAVVSGELSTPTGIFFVTITLSSEADDGYLQSGRGGVITFSFSPSTGSSDADGMIAEVSSNGVYITYPDGSGTKIPLSKNAGKRYYDIIALFALDPGSLYSVSTSGGVTTALYSGEIATSVLSFRRERKRQGKYIRKTVHLHLLLEVIVLLIRIFRSNYGRYYKGS